MFSNSISRADISRICILVLILFSMLQNIFCYLFSKLRNVVQFRHPIISIGHFIGHSVWKLILQLTFSHFYIFIYRYFLRRQSFELVAFIVPWNVMLLRNLMLNCTMGSVILVFTSGSQLKWPVTSPQVHISAPGWVLSQAFSGSGQELENCYPNCAQWV